MIKNVFKKLDELEDEYIKFWQELCLIESPTDYKEGVDKAGSYVVEKAKLRGWKIEIQKQEVSGDCVCITMNPDAKKAPVCLSGHLDTVHPVGLFGNPCVKLDDENIYGPGVADCKGGIAAAFFAMAAMEDAGVTKRPVKLILQSDEEVSSCYSNKTTIDFMCECAKGAAAFLNCEPGIKGSVVLQRKGIAKYIFDITGKAAHAANCHLGVSAITEAAMKIIELEKYKNPEGITANCGIISGGTKINTVPEKCTIQVDFRFSNEKKLEEVRSIAERVANTSYLEGTTCELMLASFRNAMELTETNIQLLETVNEIFRKNDMPILSKRAAGGGSDAAYTTICGIPTLDSVGVLCTGIHSIRESSPIASLKESARRIVAVCCEI